MNLIYVFEGTTRKLKSPATLIELREKFLEKNIRVETQEQYQELLQIKNSNPKLQIQKIQKNLDIILIFKNETQSIYSTTEIKQLKGKIVNLWPVLAGQEFYLVYQAKGYQDIDIETDNDLIKILTNIQQVELQVFQYLIVIKENNTKYLRNTTQFDQLIEYVKSKFNIPKKDQFNLFYNDQNNEKIEIQAQDDFEVYISEDKILPIYVNQTVYIQIQCIDDNQLAVKVISNLGYQQFLMEIQKRYPELNIQKIQLSYCQGEDKIEIQSKEDFDLYLEDEIRSDIQVAAVSDQSSIDSEKLLTNINKDTKIEQECIGQNDIEQKEIKQEKQTKNERQKKKIKIIDTSEAQITQKQDGIVSDLQSTQSIQQHQVNNYYNQQRNGQEYEQRNLNVQLKELKKLTFISDPKCSEHLINNLIYDLNQSINPKLDDLNKLKQMINDDEQIDSKIIDQLFDSLNTGLINNDINKMKSDLIEMLRQTRPLNIEELNLLIDRAEQAAKKVKDKEVILLMGQTGAGKSTTVYYLAGQKLTLERFDLGKGLFEFNYTHQGQIINKDLQQIKISCKSESETRYITPIEIEFEGKTAIICDSPGFGDTAGAEVDIANSIGIIGAIKMCSSVRPVILVSQLMVGDRGDGLKKLIQLIVSMFKGNIKDRLCSFTYLYSKFQEKTDINVFLQKVSLQKEDNNSSFQSVLEDMKNKTNKGEDKNQFFDKIYPLKDEHRKGILRNILDKKPIDYPEDVFSYIITENSRSKISEQINLHEKCIQSALQNFHFDLVNHKMNQLKLLQDKLKIGQLDTFYNQQVQQIKKFIDQKYQTEMQQFNLILENQNDLRMDDIQKYKNLLKQITLAEILRQNHVSDIPSSDELIQNIVQQGNILQKKLEQIDVYDYKFIINFNNLHLLNQEFSNLKNVYEKTLEQFNNYFIDQQSQSNQSIISKNYKDIALILHRIQQFNKIFDKKLDLPEINQVYNKILKQINDQITQINVECQSILKEEKFDEKKLEILIEQQYILQILSDTYEIHDYISKEIIQQALDQFYNCFIVYFEQIQDKINTIIKNDDNLNLQNQQQNQELFKSINHQFQKMEQLRKTIKYLECKSSNIYYNCLQIIANYVIVVSTKTIQQLDQLRKDPQNFNYDQFKIILKKLQKSEWIDKHQNGVYADTIQQLQNLITNQLQIWQDELDQLPIDFKNSQNIQAAYKLIQLSEKMTKFKEYFPDIDGQIKNISHQFNEALQVNLKFIEEEFKQINQENLDYFLNAETAEFSLIFLNNCNKQKYLILKIQTTSIILHSFLNSYSVNSKLQMEKYLDFILNPKNDEQSNRSFYVSKVQLRLHSLIAMDKYPNLQEFIKAPEIIKYIKDKLNQICRGLWVDSYDENYVQENLIQIQFFSNFDEFIGDKEKNFFSLQQNQKKKIINELQDDKKNLKEKIEKKQYEQFKQIQSFGTKNKKFDNDIKQILIQQMDELCYESNISLQLLKQDIEQQKLEQIILCLKHLKKASKFIPNQYIDIQELENHIKNYNNDIRNIIKGKIKSMEDRLNCNYFKEAHEIRNQITKTFTQLIDCIQADDIKQEIEGLEKLIDDRIQKQIKDQSKVQIQDYSKHPPKQLLQQLQELNEDKNNLYKKVYRLEQMKLEEQIKRDIENEINTIFDGNYELKNKKIKDLEDAIKFLPGKLNEEYVTKIKGIKFQIDEIKKNLKKELEDLKYSDNIMQQFQFIKRCKQDKNDEFQKYMQDYLNTKLGQIQSQIESFIQIKDYSNALKNYLNLIQYHKIFGEQNFLNYVNVSKQILQQKFEDFITELQQIKQKYQNQNQAIIEKYYEYYQQFIEINNNIEVIVNNDLNLTFHSENEKKLEEDLIQYFQQLQNSYFDSLNNLQMRKLEESLQGIKSWQYLIRNIQNCLNMPNLKNILNKIKDYKTIQKDVARFLQDNQEEIQEQNFNMDLQDKQLQQHYQKLQRKIEFNGQASRIRDHIQNDYDNIIKIEQDINTKQLNKLKDLINQTINLIQKGDKEINFVKVRINLKNLIIYERISKQQEINNGIESIKNLILNRVQEYYKICINQPTKFEIVVENLINIQLFIDEIPQVSQEIRKKMSDVLQKLKQQCNSTEFSQIFLLLDQDNGAGKSIIQEHEQYFKGFQIQLFKSNTAKHNKDYIMKYIEGDSLDNDLLLKFYNRYEEKYQALIKKYIVNQNSSQVIMELVNKVKSKPTKKINYQDIQWNVQNEIIEIMACIFTIWTFYNIQYYDEMKDLKQEQRDEYLWQPHSGQIIAIFRILGIGYEDGYFKNLFGFNESRLVNNLIQIGTGEGKSVTLAVTACILGLYDIDVYCACYSEYLSQRDYKSFSNLFEKLGLVDRIHYGTFNQLCEDVINDKFNIRQKVTDIVQSGSSEDPTKINNRHKILLIDEVDVFFSEDFYGNIYAPIAKIKNEKIKALTDFLWENREKKFTMKQIENIQQFKELCKQFIGWEQLIKEIVKNMNQDLLCFKHDYVVQNYKIGYKEQDQIVFNVVYGYKTMWAHYDEFYNDNITQKVLEDNISIQIKCGSFSFAEIPKSFLNILGVSGTLKTMSEAQKKIISDDYKIKIFTYMPSIFGKNQCEFNEKASVRFWDKDDYFKEIKVEIKNNIGEKPNLRACLVFFETKEKLKEFYEYYSSEESNIQFVTEETSSDEQSSFIKKSTNPGSVTLLTKLFGRGIDFIVRDQNISSNKGIHVIQTYLSEEVSEETQIKGRTARQGQKGTFSMVLLDEDLEKFVGPKYLEELKDMQDNNNLYSRLNEKRNQYFNNKQQSISEMIQMIKKEHDEAVNFIQSLLDKQIEKIQNFLLQQNRGEPEQIQSRTICLMDATGSMSSLLQKTKNTVGQMFKRASDILKENNATQDCFQLKFVVYRDYDCKDGILQFSPWQSKPEQLRTFMETITAQGGGDYAEAIEIGLLHCNKENEDNDINSIILIGDAPAKEQSAIDRDRKTYGGEDYWIKKGFPYTHYRKEIKKLNEKGIPIHSFYLHNGAKSNFEEISRLTQGKSGMLQIDKDSGSEQLTALVTETILQSLPKGNQLVESYRKKFGKAFA